MALITLFITIFLSTPVSLGSSLVTSSVTLENTSDSTVDISFELDISRGWHVYSTNLPSGGPVSAELVLDSVFGLALNGELRTVGIEKDVYDPVFEMRVRYFERKVRFVQSFNVLSEFWYVDGNLTYGACSDESCLPPQRAEFSFRGAEGETFAEAGPNLGKGSLDEVQGYDAKLWLPVSYDSVNSHSEVNGLWGLLFTSFLAGLLALLTPCVWPVIPMTVSYFLKRSENRKSAVKEALLYGVSIVTVYVSLGIVITLIFGANALNSLSTNAIVNLVFFVVLVAFALSFFGLFEITLPSGWSTVLSRKSTSSGGIAGIFLMAATLSIVSFSCTGPIIGFLLVDAASNGGIAAPTVGMLGFSIALAIPFGLFAMFPHWLKSMPKSGGWMEKVKVVLGFIELAFSLKFLSVADMAYGWGILPRDLFLLLWILMAILLGFYLLGVVRFNRKGSSKKPGWLSVMSAIVCLAFAAWMVPGLWGAPLRAVSAFTPPMSTQRYNMNKDLVEPDCTDYIEGLTLSEISGKPVLIDFTGYGCVNCRKMEASVWTDSEIASVIRERFVLVSLFVDDKQNLERSVIVDENGAAVKIRTVGDKWSLLQRYKFGANAQPFYVIVDCEGRLISGPYAFDTNKDHFAAFLKSAL